VDAARPALAGSLANALDVLGLTDPATEMGLEVLGRLQPCRPGDADPLQDRRQILDITALLARILSRRDIDPDEVILQMEVRHKKRQASIDNAMRNHRLQ